MYYFRKGIPMRWDEIFEDLGEVDEAFGTKGLTPDQKALQQQANVSAFKNNQPVPGALPFPEELKRKFWDKMLDKVAFGGVSDLGNYVVALSKDPLFRNIPLPTLQKHTEEIKKDLLRSAVHHHAN